MVNYYKERIAQLESEIEVFGATEEREAKLEVFKEKLEKEIGGNEEMNNKIKGKSQADQMEVIAKMGLKRGDTVSVKFIDGEEVTFKVVRIGYCRKQTKDSKSVERFYIKDTEGVCWDIWTIDYLEVLERSKRSTKVLTEGLKQFNYSLQYYKALEFNKQCCKGILPREEESNGNKPSVGGFKEQVEEVLKDNNMTLGCWDNKIESLSTNNFNKVLGAVKFGDNAEVLVRLRSKYVVVNIDVVDNELDLEVITKADYIHRRGEYAWEDLLEWEGK